MESKKYLQSIYKFDRNVKSHSIEDSYKNHYIEYIFEPMTNELVHRNKYNIKFSIKNTHYTKSIHGSFNIEIEIPKYKKVEIYNKYNLSPQQKLFVTIIDDIIYGEDSLIMTVEFLDGPHNSN